MHCASPLRTIFASLARAHERLENVKNFPQVKLDGEINARFLLTSSVAPNF